MNAKPWVIDAWTNGDKGQLAQLLMDMNFDKAG